MKTSVFVQNVITCFISCLTGRADAKSVRIAGVAMSDSGKVAKKIKRLLVQAIIDINGEDDDEMVVNMARLLIYDLDEALKSE